VGEKFDESGEEFIAILAFHGEGDLRHENAVPRLEVVAASAEVGGEVAFLAGELVEGGGELEFVTGVRGFVGGEDFHDAGREDVHPEEAEIVALAEAGGEERLLGLGGSWFLDHASHFEESVSALEAASADGAEEGQLALVGGSDGGDRAALAVGLFDEQSGAGAAGHFGDVEVIAHHEQERFVAGEGAGAEDRVAVAAGFILLDELEPFAEVAGGFFEDGGVTGPDDDRDFFDAGVGRLAEEYVKHGAGVAVGVDDGLERDFPLPGTGSGDDGARGFHWGESWPESCRNQVETCARAPLSLDSLSPASRVAPMNLLSGSMFLGRFFGINVRLHWTLFFGVAFRMLWFLDGKELDGMAVGMAVALVVAMFLSILAHEFGHSLTCRFVKGRADEILMWPLGGLAFCRPPYHPTAHLLTTIMGPMVTVVLWLLFAYVIPSLGVVPAGPFLELVLWVGHWNFFILCFNLLPGFPMDGGRIVRDVLWHFIGFERSTLIAVTLGRITGFAMIMSGLGFLDFLPLPSILTGSGWLVMMGAMVLWSNMSMERVFGGEGSGEVGYSMKDHAKQAKRKAAFARKLKEEGEIALHECATCGATEISDPELEFRVHVDDEEYCEKHLPGS